MYKKIIKPSIDFLVALTACVFLLPVFSLIALFLLFANHGKVFFIQERPGKNGKIFRLIKFKTMTDEVDSYGRLLPDEMRLNRVGRFIRSTSLDEIPQLLNVIKGEMSLVGPRPLLVEYLPLYSQAQKRRHDVRPGITGWAQINGRNELTWSKKFELDIWYVDHISFFLDLRILLLTIKKVFIKEGISSRTYVTMEPFDGTV